MFGWIRCVFLAFVALASSSVTSGAIEWRVKAPFSPHNVPYNAADLANVWLPQEHSADGRVETFVEWHRRLFSTGSETTAMSPYAPGRVNSLVEGPVRPESVDLLASLHGVDGMCKWSIRDKSGAIRVVHEAIRCDEKDILLPDVAAEGDVLVVSNGASPWTEPVHVERLVIVGLGDSYASGEGNPDVPSRWREERAPDNHDWLRRKHGEFMLVTGAQWADKDCRRSFFSHQNYVAMRLAVESPHRHVTFLHYACSGAEVFDGLLVRQRLSGRTSLEKSQLNAMMGDLCSEPQPARLMNLVGNASAVNRLTRNPRRTDVRIQWLHEPFRVAERMGQFQMYGLDASTCSGPVMPDAIMVSIGGNDIAFGGLVRWAILPHSSRGYATDFGWQVFRSAVTVCPAERKPDERGCSGQIYKLLDELPRRIDAFATALEDVLPGASRHVVLNSYPVGTTYVAEIGLRRCGDSGNRVNPENPWDGVRALGARDSWELNFTEGEAWYFSRSSASLTMPRLFQALKSGAERNHFAFAGSVQTAFDGHGWCSQTPGDEPLALPSRAPNQWICRGEEGRSLVGSPACWEPYRPSSRYIRTINDSLLTQSDTNRDDSAYGAFHPNGMGQAAIADALWGHVKSVVAASKGVEATTSAASQQ